MRWKRKPKDRPQLDDTRIVKRFFFLPRLFGETWVWLEVAQVRQTRVDGKHMPFLLPKTDKWRTTHLVDK